MSLHMLDYDPEKDAEPSEQRRDMLLMRRTIEADWRAAEAGAVNRAARCVCGHSGIHHADVMTSPELTGHPRIPCAMAGCPCDDLAYQGPTP